MSKFSDRLLDWFDQHGRHDLPWQHPRTPYRVWLAEVMLQQTQVATVIPYFLRFIELFPDWQALAAAPLDEVLKHWAGLGYYARARNLHQAAQVLVRDHASEVPQDLATLVELPGLGRSTAAAILAQAFDQRHAILDGNVRRVLARHAAVPGWPGLPAVTRQLWQEAETRLPDARQVGYAQAMMDLGATLCTARRPACGRCPVAADCQAHLTDRVAEFPASRPARTRPSRQSFALLIENAAGDVLLERRPPSGIWGGLWCLPMFEPDEDWRAGLVQRYGLHVSEPQAQASLHHAFTHFDLELRPLRVVVTGFAAGVQEQRPQQWTKLRGADRPGLPTPIAKLLDRPQLDLQLADRAAPKR